MTRPNNKKVARDLKLSPQTIRLLEDPGDGLTPKQLSNIEEVDPNIIKTLVVELADGTRKPHFTFEGDWTGKDLGIVFRHLRKAYLMHNRDIRRAQTANNLDKMREEATYDNDETPEEDEAHEDELFTSKHMAEIEGQ